RLRDRSARRATRVGGRFVRLRLLLAEDRGQALHSSGGLGHCGRTLRRRTLHRLRARRVRYGCCCAGCAAVVARLTTGRAPSAASAARAACAAAGYRHLSTRRDAVRETLEVQREFA